VVLAEEDNMNKERFIILISVIIICILVSCIYIFKGNENTYDFKVHFFNIGKADSMIISYDGHYIMIDCGEEDNSNEILTYMRNNNITKLDYLIITHFDKDHVGGASKIIDNIEIDNVLQSNSIKTSDEYNNYIDSLNKKSITPTTVNGDLDISFSDLEIIVNGPDVVYENNESNNSSLIVSITYKSNNFLFMGDAQNARIKDFIKTNDIKYDFIKIPYHGNYLKRLDDLFNDNTIKYSVITSSNSEMENDDTIKLLNKYEITNYLTRLGSIDVLSDGINIKINQY